MGRLVKLPARLTNARYWPKDLSPGAKLQRVALLCPKEFRAIMVLVDDILKRYYHDQRHHPPRP
jgi:hypothetical protein